MPKDEKTLKLYMRKDERLPKSLSVRSPTGKKDVLGEADDGKSLVQDRVYNFAPGEWTVVHADDFPHLKDYTHFKGGVPVRVFGRPEDDKDVPLTLQEQIAALHKQSQDLRSLLEAQGIAPQPEPEDEAVDRTCPRCSQVAPPEAVQCPACKATL